MSDGTKIEWTDATWNPITGCSVISPGCTNCYAMKLAGTRLRNHPSRADLTHETKAGPVWNGKVRFNEQWLDQPLRWKRPRRIFVCAHGDLFHEDVPDEWIDKVFAVMAISSHHTFQVLTKRALRMREYFTIGAWLRIGNLIEEVKPDALWNGNACQAQLCVRDCKPFPNIWLGVSVEDQKRADERIPLLIDTPAAVRFLSAEPLLGPISLTGSPTKKPAFTDIRSAPEMFYTPPLLKGIQWVIVGGESGPGARRMFPEWARLLRDQCLTYDIVFLFKQWGEWAPYGRGQTDGVDLATPYSLDHPMQQFGKKLSGRLLDGREWNEFPDAGMA